MELHSYNTCIRTMASSLTNSGVVIPAVQLGEDKRLLGPTARQDRHGRGQDGYYNTEASRDGDEIETEQE